MKSFLKDVRATLFSDKGILHFIGIIFLIYLLTYWGNSRYAQTTPLFPSSMLASLFRQHFLLQLFLVSFFGFGLGYFIERFQKIYLKAKSQISDVIWTTFGAPWGWFLYKFFGANNLLFGISISVLLIIMIEIAIAISKKLRSNT